MFFGFVKSFFSQSAFFWGAADVRSGSRRRYGITGMRVPPVSYDSWDSWDGRVRHAMARDHRTACPVCWAYAAYTAYSSRKSCTAGPAFRPVSRHCREPAPQGPGNAKRRKDFSCRQCVVGSPFREAVKSPLFNDDAPGRNGRCLATPYYTYIPPLLLLSLFFLTLRVRKWCP